MPDAITLTIESRENMHPAVTEALALPAPQLTAGELITLRVHHTTAHRPPQEQEAAVRQALHAFRQGLYLLVVNDQRVTDLAEHLTLTERSRVRFWRLLPLVGG
jgi:hypothetical protein